MIEHDDAQRLFQTLGQTRANNGGTMTRDEWLRIAAEHFRAAREDAGGPKRKRVKGMRDILFDTLAECTGLNLKELGKAGARAVGVALADIRAVSPDLTPEEIKRRCGAYRRLHPTWALTAPAIAKNWASLGGGDPTRTAKLDIYQEPKDWHGAVISLYGKDVGEQLIEKGWANICILYGRDILAKLAS